MFRQRWWIQKGFCANPVQIALDRLWVVRSQSGLLWLEVWEFGLCQSHFYWDLQPLFPPWWCIVVSVWLSSSLYLGLEPSCPGRWILHVLTSRTSVAWEGLMAAKRDPIVRLARLYFPNSTLSTEQREVASSCRVDAAREWCRCVAPCAFTFSHLIFKWPE